MTDKKELVPLGEMRTLRGHGTLTCKGIGSGVALCLFDTASKVGSMAHVLLEESSREIDGDEAKYASHAVKATLEAALEHGAQPGQVSAILIGGARLMSDLEGFDLGISTAARLRLELAAMEVPIRLEETGGSLTRFLEVNVETGHVEVFSIPHREATVCELRAA